MVLVRTNLLLQLMFAFSCGDNLVGVEVVTQEAYVKPSNTRPRMEFGRRVSISADGRTIAIGADQDSSGATHINGDGTDTSAVNSGAVYVYVRAGYEWLFEAYIKPSNTDAGDFFGSSVALSDDGSVLVVGAQGESSSLVEDPDNNGARNSGAVYVFTRADTEWGQQAYLKASNGDVDDAFGVSVALSGDGNRLIVGAVGESSSTGGFNAEQTNNEAPNSGAAYVFDREGSNWIQTGYLKPMNIGAGNLFGWDVSIASNGGSLAVSAVFENNDGRGVNQPAGPETLDLSGAAYVFSYDDSSWQQQAYIKASNAGIADVFGFSLRLSGDGTTLAVGATGEASSDDGVNADQFNNDADASGAVYVFRRTEGSWAQQDFIKASNSDPGDAFGASLSLSYDGGSLAVGAANESSKARGIDSEQRNNEMPLSGAVYLFTRDDTSWRQRSYIKSSNSDENDLFGVSCAFDADGTTLIVGASGEASRAMNLNGNQLDNSAPRSGAAFLFFAAE